MLGVMENFKVKAAVPVPAWRPGQATQPTMSK